MTRPGEMVRLSPRARVFRSIYTKNRWNGTETRSGPGSTFASTRRLREALPRLVDQFQITSVLDAACGASYWMPDLPGYVGVDIVPEAIEAVCDAFPTRRYEVADIVTDDLPRCDAVIVRDVLAHLMTRDAVAALENIRRTGARWLFATTFVGADNSIPAATGGYHEIDLTAAPFGLPKPVRLIPDGYWEEDLIYPTKQMGVWQMS